MIALGGMFVPPRAIAAVAAASAETTDLPHVILIGLDTVRADHLGCYGNDHVRTPHLDRFAESAVLFEDCLSTSSWTFPSFASMFTGLLPDRHGAIGGPHNRLDPRAKTLAQILSAAGYRTVSFAAVDYLTEAFGMARGFARHDDYLQGPVTGRSDLYQDQVLRSIAGEHSRPWFLFAHYFDAHDPYTAPAPFHRMYYEGDPTAEPADRSRSIEVIYSQDNRVGSHPRTRYRWLEGIRDLRYPVREYAAGISYLDSRLGEVLDALESGGYFENSIVVIAGDHGEHLTEHDLYFTHRFPYIECSHVPLLIRLPGGAEGGRRVTDPVSLVDVLPTLLELLGLTSEVELDGISLVGALHGASIPERVLFAEYGGREENEVKAAWTAHYRYLEFSIGGRRWAELYDRRRDPAETTDRIHEEPERAAAFEALLTERFGKRRHLLRNPDAPTPALDPRVRARLRALGYVH